MRRLLFMRLGWGYALLGLPVWTVMLHVMPPSSGPPDLVPFLLAAGVAAAVVSLTVPAVYQRAPGLRARLLRSTPLGPDASDDERAAERKRREVRAFELYLVTWVISLIAAGVPGMVGLMLGVLGKGLVLAHAFILIGLVLTVIRFPNERRVLDSVERP
jgi:hypothetical protein